jgi:hypothetical protein
LNQVLSAHPEAKRRGSQPLSSGYSFASWDQVQPYFPVVSGSFPGTASSGLSQDHLDALQRYLSCASTCFGSLVDGGAAKRMHLIAPVIIIVCSHFRGDVQILAEEAIRGNRVRAHGVFEFVLKRNDKRLCIVDAKREDLLQGRAHGLLGCEALCDVEDIPVTYAIATNYTEWLFLKNEAAVITEQLLTISFDEDGHPIMDSLKRITDKIIAILE